MTQWEIKSVRLSVSQSEQELAERKEELNQMGRYGWELVSVTESDFHISYHFKRPLSANRTASQE